MLEPVDVVHDQVNSQPIDPEQDQTLPDESMDTENSNSYSCEYSIPSPRKHKNSLSVEQIAQICKASDESDENSSLHFCKDRSKNRKRKTFVYYKNKKK